MTTSAINENGQGASLPQAHRFAEPQKRVGRAELNVAPGWRPASRRLAEIRRAHRGIVEQRLGVALERDLARLHHVAATADLERELRVLLDQQDRDAFAAIR